jgi:predicted  nucleic acid-binding Zn-ribbon protein
MQSDLTLLINLQKIDAAVDELQARALAMLPQIAKKNAELEALKARLKAAKDKSNAAGLKRKALEGQVEEKEKEISKHQGALNSLKSNDAYKAMLGEIENAKKDKSKIEDDILALMEQIDAAEKEYKATEQTIKTQEGTIKAAIQALEKEKADLESQAAAKKSERDAFAATITPVSLTQYDALRSRRGGMAIVPVENGACGGCQMNLPHTKIQQLKQGRNVVYCENCTRILFIPAAAPTAPAPSPAA